MSKKIEMKSAICIIVETKGSTPRKAGTKMTVFEDGSIEGSIGGGNFEKKVIEDAVQQIQLGNPRLFEHHLLQEHEMCCGGSVKVYIEPGVEKQHLIIFGAGHVGQELAVLGVKANFTVSIYDDRVEYIRQINNPQVQTYHCDFTNVLKEIEFNENTFITILTYNHSIDRNILRYCLKKSYAYLGFIGSHRKIIVTKKMMQQEGVATNEELENVNMPIGIEIGAQTPFEIAVSIISKIIAVKNKNRIKAINQINEIELCLQKQPL